MLEMLDTYDWEEAFKYASPTVCQRGHNHGPQAVIVDDNVSTDSYTREDVMFILALEEGENDGDTWIGVFQLKDGRYVSLRAWCDYTGWG